MLVAMLIIKAFIVCKSHLHGFGLVWKPTLIGCTFSFGFFQNPDSFQHWYFVIDIIIISDIKWNNDLHHAHKFYNENMVG